MRLTLESEDKKYGALPEGEVLTAEITKCELQEKSWNDSRTGEPAKRIAFEFTLLDDDFARRKIWEDLFTSFYPSERCKLYVWALKIMGRDELPEGFTLDTEAFVGSRVPIVLSTRHFTKRNGEPGSAQQAEILSETEAASMRRAQAGEGGQVEAPKPNFDVDAGISSGIGSEGIAPLDDDDNIEPF